MGKAILIVAVILFAAIMTACETTSTPAASTAQTGKPLGDTRVRVSGVLDVGGRAAVR